uniref:Cytochrome P450 n=1 Tax=Oryza punctata TaxID=4537 RepID=A0A0E0L2K6_ORYPU
MYDPDRFAPKREEDKVGGMFSYTLFGGGRHICIGEAYAYMQIKVIWSHLLRNLKLALLPNIDDEGSSLPDLEPTWITIHMNLLASCHRELRQLDLTRQASPVVSPTIAATNLGALLPGVKPEGKELPPIELVALA